MKNLVWALRKSRKKNIGNSGCVNTSNRGCAKTSNVAIPSNRASKSASTSPNTPYFDEVDILICLCSPRVPQVYTGYVRAPSIHGIYPGPKYTRGPRYVHTGPQAFTGPMSGKFSLKDVPGPQVYTGPWAPLGPKYTHHPQNSCRRPQ